MPSSPSGRPDRRRRGGHHRCHPARRLDARRRHDRRRRTSAASRWSSPACGTSGTKRRGRRRPDQEEKRLRALPNVLPQRRRDLGEDPRPVAFALLPEQPHRRVPRRSVRSSSQRQSASRDQAPPISDVPSAPARCAVMVSDVITRSRSSIAAAISLMPSGLSVILGAERLYLHARGKRRKLVEAVHRLQADQADARNCRERHVVRERRRAPAVARIAGLPCQAMPTLKRPRRARQVPGASGRRCPRRRRGRESDSELCRRASRRRAAG